MDSRLQKAAIRAQVLARRDGIDPVERIEFAMAAAGHGVRSIDFDPGTIISGFMPIRSEIDLRPLMDALRLAGARLCVPAVVDRQTIVFRALVPGAPLEPTGFGTAGPGPDAEMLEPQIMLMPLAAFDAQGNRIGYGAGHYDRAISRLRENGRSPRLIGCAFSVQEVDLVPAEPHDIRMDAVLTEKGYREFSD
ncbi:MAG: 5-formyltetrahydrofolate cyclo-ligase [Nitratireductor sp.]|nr:5-formyltetrahydrofolate cyclo-ligase [Nitratireductor sp.]